MFASLRSRLWLTYALLIGVVLFVVGSALVVYFLNNPLVERQAATRLRLVVNSLNNQRFLQGFDGDVEQVVTRISENFDVRISVFRGDGLLVADSQTDGEALNINLAEFPFNADAPPVLRTRDSSGQLWLYTAAPVLDRFFVLVATPRPRASLASILTDDLFVPLIQAGALALLLSLVLAFLISRWVAAPLQRMAEAVGNVATGYYGPIEPQGPREVRHLANAFNDMTTRVQASQQSQRDFVANVSHELKTPLTSIQGFAQAILDGTADSPETQQQSASVIHDEAGRMHRLVVDLLDLARLDAGTADLARAPLDLAALLDGVARKLAPQSQQASIDLQADIPALPSFIGDGDRLAQVFTNLVDNAIKYTPAGGQVLLRAKQQNGNVQVSIADNGPGISKEELSRIFERFYQIDKSRSGNGHSVGLGLAIAQQIVHAHGGHITAHSEKGRGSVFVITLPVARPDDVTMAIRRVD
ncbi:MAG: sensor histidine kinase [Chloroflexi bacterium]|nr:MAG: sensor histidine kinase [Chloroflexota bacterium]MBL1195308.1 sensor histidine kinase [Chloroflexota bacterium]NOH12592.1 HAMP domain-containing histidine kinase [Chloroflexota bacterium]